MFLFANISEFNTDLPVLFKCQIPEEREEEIGEFTLFLVTLTHLKGEKEDSKFMERGPVSASLLLEIGPSSAGDRTRLFKFGMLALELARVPVATLLWAAASK